MSEYIKVKLGDLIEERNERCSDPQESGYERFVGLEHMDTGRLEVKRYGSTDDVTTSCKLCHKGDMLFGRRNPYLRRAGVINFDSTCSGDIIVFRPSSDRIVPEYIPIVLATKQFWTAAMTDQGGTMSKRVHFEDFSQYEFDLPDLDTQRKLSELIWSYEKLICDCEEQLQNLDLLVKSRFIEMFSDEIANESLYRPLKSVCILGPQNGIYKKDLGEVGNANIVKMTQMFDGDSINENQTFDTIHIESKEVKFLLKEGDLIFGRRSLVVSGAGKCSWVDKLSTDTVFESSLIRFTPDKTQIEPRYVCQWLKTPKGEMSVNRIRRVVTVAGVTGTDIGNLRIPIPDISKQTIFVDFVKQIDKSKFKLQQYLDYLKAMQISVINGPKVNP